MIKPLTLPGRGPAASGALPVPIAAAYGGVADLRTQPTTDSDLGYLPRSEPWSRLGESNPGPAHYEEAAPRLLWRLPATTVTALTPLDAPAAP
jgi:hypothetical protein